MKAEAPPGFLQIVRGIWSIGRTRWRTLIAAGLVIFVPLGLIETIDLSVQEAFAEREGESLLDVLEVAGVGGLHAVGAIFGEVLFAGAVTAVVLVERSRHKVSLRSLLSELALGKLALADVLLVLVVIAGLLALVVPGVVFLVWFALIGPVIEVKHAGVREAFRRSRELVRRRFWLVASFVIPLLLLDEALGGLAHEAAEALFGETFAGEWVAGTLTGLVTSLPLALAAVVIYLELAGLPSDERRSSSGTGPPVSPRSRPAAST